MFTTCPLKVFHLARIRLLLEHWEDLWQPSGPGEKSSHNKLCDPVLQRGETLSAILLSPRSFIINPLSLSPRQLEYDSNFLCLDADCKDVGGAILLQISSPQPRNQDNFPMHILQGWRSCRAICSEGFWFAVFTTETICKIHQDLYKGSRIHKFLYMATS